MSQDSLFGEEPLLRPSQKQSTESPTEVLFVDEERWSQSYGEPTRGTTQAPHSASLITGTTNLLSLERLPSNGSAAQDFLPIVGVFIRWLAFGIGMVAILGAGVVLSLDLSPSRLWQSAICCAWFAATAFIWMTMRHHTHLRALLFTVLSLAALAWLAQHAGYAGHWISLESLPKI